MPLTCSSSWRKNWTNSVSFLLMSASDKKISHVSSRAGLSGGVDRNNVDDNEDDDDDESVNAGGKYEIDGDQKKLRRHGYDGFGKNIRKIRQTIRLHFATAKKKLISINNIKKGSCASSYGAISGTLRSSDTRRKDIFHRTGQPTGASFRGCYFCFSRPKNLESPGGSQTSNIEAPNFTNAMLRTFIEKNDFRSKECNPYLKQNFDVRT